MTGSHSTRAQRLIDTAPDAFIGMDADDVVTDWNRAATRLFGYEAHEAIGRKVSDLIIRDEDRAAHRKGVRRVLQTGVPQVQGKTFQVVARRRDGHEFPIDLTIWTQYDDVDGVSFYAFLRDVSERVATAEVIGRLAAIVTSSPDAMVTVDLDGTIASWNPGAERIYGYRHADIVGRSASTLVPDDRAFEFGRILDEIGNGRTIEQFETVRVRADGTHVDVSLTIAPVLDGEGQVVRIAYVSREITAAKEARRSLQQATDAVASQAERMRELAYHDALTGLANRSLLLERLHEVDGSTPMALLMIDVDDFKYVNDTLGHSAGDELLRALAGKLTGLIGDRGVVARIGGDEFAILAGCLDELGASKLAQQVTDRLAEPVPVAGHMLATRASVGVALAERGWTDTPETLLRNADLAMYAAKASAKGSWRRYEPAMHEASTARLQLEADLRVALSAGQFWIAYQPICDTRTGLTREVEALLRWQHPQHGAISPVDFIPVAEQTGAIVDIGIWVLRSACREVTELASTGTDLGLAVNLAPRQLAEPGFVDVVADTLREARLPAHRLTLEVTESMIASPDGTMAAQLRDLRELGVNLAVDDFGTGHSSLGRLRTLPFTTLKIDKSFVDEITEERRNDVIVHAVVAMAHGLGLRVVAEGVETALQLGQLRQLGCDFVQGFLLNKPMAPGDLRRHLLDQGVPAELQPVPVA